MGERIMPIKKPGDPGLWDAIRAKRKRIAAGSGERMRKAGDPKRPTKADFVRSQKTAKKPRGGKK